MKTVFTCPAISASGTAASTASGILKSELKERLGVSSVENGTGCDLFVELLQPGESSVESFNVEQKDRCIKITAYRLRGFIYAVGLLLRKCEKKDGSLVLTRNLSGNYSPALEIRGHGMGYTDMSNTYEAWDKATLKRYILDLMFFGLNTVETSFARNDRRTALMKYSFPEAMQAVSECCLELDADLTVWYALTKTKTADETASELLKLLGSAPKVTSLFLPGGDPGDMQADEFIEECRKIKKIMEKKFPGIQLWPSAQAPHEFPDWGERFTGAMAEKPDEITGIIYGPNHAMSLSELRRNTDCRYSLEQYPDICHNVRCESPVHYYDDDWHFAYAATLGRESVNPRPVELKRLHRNTSRYVSGNCSYSEGVNDDVNKVVWSSLDFNPDESLREILKDYSRLFFAGISAETTADIIFGLEQNWFGDPVESSSVDYVYAQLKRILSENSTLKENWRFRLMLFRAESDKLVRDRRMFELSLLEEAVYEIRYGCLKRAGDILSSPFTQEYKALRKNLFDDAADLYRLIGIQLDTEHFGGMNPERGCVLDTVDMPVTDREYLLKMLQKGFGREALLRAVDRNRVDRDEFYFSFALDGFAVCGKQSGEFYMDFCGDRNGDADLPMCLTKGYDHFSFETEIAGLTGGDYILKVTYRFSSEEESGSLTIKANGNTVYSGVFPGGERDYDFEARLLPEGYTCRCYRIKKEYIQNGCMLLEMNESTTGFVVPEFRIIKAGSKENSSE